MDPKMDRYGYAIYYRRHLLVLGILQVACASLCVVCGLIDAGIRKNTPLSTTRTPLWGGAVVSLSGVLALFDSQRKNRLLMGLTVASTGFSSIAAIFVSIYSGLTVTYGEEDTHIFQHHSPELKFVLHRMVKGANATILLSCIVSLVLSSLIAYMGCRSLLCCGCYDTRLGLETLVPPCDPRDIEMMCSMQGGNGELFHSPAWSTITSTTEENEDSSNLMISAGQGRLISLSG